MCVHEIDFELPPQEGIMWKVVRVLHGELFSLFAAPPTGGKPLAAGKWLRAEVLPDISRTGLAPARTYKPGFHGYKARQDALDLAAETTYETRVVKCKYRKGRLSGMSTIWGLTGHVIVADEMMILAEKT